MPGTNSGVSPERGLTNSVTIVICTYTENRWVTLQSAINAAVKQTHFADEILIIVDYNDSLLERCRDTFDRCTVIPNCHGPGLSGARNTGIDHAHGSIIAFLDDDAVPVDGWLYALRAPYADTNVYGVGGPATPRWLAGQPQWFPAEFLWVVGCSYLGLPSTPHSVRNLLGANMSFRQTAFEQVGGFAEQMGRTKERPLSCEETEFSIRLTQATPSAILLHDPSAQVEHYVAEQRGSLKYFAKRCWAEGHSKADVTHRVGRTSALSAETHYTLRILPKGVWRGFRDSIKGDVWGMGRSVAIVGGLVLTIAGYWVRSLYGRSYGYSKGE